MLLAVSVAFTICGYGVLYAAGQSVIRPVLALWDMMSADAPIADDGEEYVDLYESAKKPDVTPEQPTDSIASSAITFPLYNTRYANITVEGTDVDCPLFFGDSNTALKKGAGQYAGSSYPGMGSTILVAGHNNTFFHGLKDVQIGALIRVSTHYGEYVYRVTRTAICRNTDSSAYDLAAETENIVLYTCYPFNELGLTPQRFFVYGEYVSGPQILLYE